MGKVICFKTREVLADSDLDTTEMLAKRKQKDFAAFIEDGTKIIEEELLIDPNFDFFKAMILVPSEIDGIPLIVSGSSLEEAAAVIEDVAALYRRKLGRPTE